MMYYERKYDYNLLTNTAKISEKVIGFADIALTTQVSGGSRLLYIRAVLPRPSGNARGPRPGPVTTQHNHFIFRLIFTLIIDLSTLFPWLVITSLGFSLK